jgi:hypothetical protein
MTRPINPPVHPGEILCEQFLVPRGMSAEVNAVALIEDEKDRRLPAEAPRRSASGSPAD